MSTLRSLAALILSSFCFGEIARASLPDMRWVARPNPEPSAQPGWDVFLPPITTSVVAPQAPTIAEWTRTAGPGETLILTGDKFSSNPTASERDADLEFVVYGQTTAQDGFQSPLALRRLEGEKAAATLPFGLASASTFFVWPKNMSGYGHPVAVNRTEAWWLNPDDQATRGGTVSVYGRHLSHAGGTALSWVYLKMQGQAGEWAPVSSVNPYRIQFQVPASLQNGKYEVWIHNGHGGSYGWSGPLSLTVTDAHVWNGTHFNVRDYGATGNGRSDDTDAVTAAYTAAAQYRDRSGLHPTLYFPAGTYMLRYGLGLERNIRILGTGKQATTLRCSAKFDRAGNPADGPKLGLIFANGGVVRNIEIRDLTLDANDHFRQPLNQDHLVYCQFEPGTSDVRFTNVRIEILAPGIGAAFLNNITRLSMVGCDFIGGGVMLFNGRQHEITGCSFLGANDSPAAIVQRGTSELSVTNCFSADLDLTSPTGQGLGRFIAANGDYGTQRNIYIGENTTVDCGPRIGATDQNSGEQVMCEGNITRFEGNPTAVSATTATFSTLSANFIGQTAVICRGKGLGQHRIITGYNSASRTITVTPAWNVVPDRDSTVMIANAADRWVIYRNHFDGKNDYASRPTATTAIEPFGGCYNWVGDSNVISHMRIAIYVTALEQTSPVASIAPCYFNYYANNSITESYRGLHVASGIREDIETVGILGNVFRHNTLSDLKSSGINLYTPPQLRTGSPFDMILFEKNTFSNLAEGLDFDERRNGSRVKNTLLLGNSFHRGTAPFGGSLGVNFAATTFTPTFADNTWIGFERSYAGMPSDLASAALHPELVWPDFSTKTVASDTRSDAVSPKLTGISARSFVGAGDALQVAGFVITGSVPKPVLIRASGPALTSLGVPGALIDPVLTLYSDQTLLARNDDWSADGAGVAIDATVRRIGGYAWSQGSRDAALLVTLKPGNYSTHVTGKNGETGVAMVEIYEVDSNPAASRLGALSSRMQTGSGANMAIAGFVIGGATAKKVLIRASGPALEQFGVPNILPDPILTLFSGGTTIMQNDDWSSSPTETSKIEAAVAGGALTWPRGTKDAALLVTLPPGAYTTHVRGGDIPEGITLLEIYEVP